MKYSEENKLAPAAVQLKDFHKGKLTYILPKQTLFFLLQFVPY
jgi:hypothetical protein